MTPGEEPGLKSGAEMALKLRHDLANPLAAVLAETQLLLLSPELLNPETLAGLKQIETLARRMRQILQDFAP
jgi:signal transduction histidine kinase